MFGPPQTSLLPEDEQGMGYLSAPTDPAQLQALMQQAQAPQYQPYQESPQDLSEAKRRMWAQAVANIGAGFSRQPMGPSPVEAYQAALAEKERRHATNFQAKMLQANAARGLLTPDLIEFMAAKSQGFPGGLAEWKLVSATTGRPNDFQVKMAAFQDAKRREMKAKGDPNADTAELSYDELTNLLRQPQSGQMAGIPFVMGADGQPRWLGSPEQAAQWKSDIAEGEAGGKSWGAQDAAFDMAAGDALDSLSSTKSIVQKMRETIESNPDMPTGMLVGKIAPYYSDVVSRLNTLSTIATVPALSAAKLQPVSEKELETIRETFASALRDPRANLSALQAQMEWLDTKIAEWNRKMDFFEEKGTMRGYSVRAARRSKQPGSPALTPGPDGVIDLPSPGAR